MNPSLWVKIREIVSTFALEQDIRLSNLIIMGFKAL
jgi:hypothetical protein